MRNERAQLSRETDLALAKLAEITLKTAGHLRRRSFALACKAYETVRDLERSAQKRIREENKGSKANEHHR